MKYARRRRIVDGSTGVGSHMLTLSVFIMLLAFFIVLNAISSVTHQKSGPALRSIEKTFSRVPGQVPSLPNTGDAEEAGTGRGDALEGVESLFRAELPGLKAEKDESRGALHIHMTREAFLRALEQTRTVQLPDQSVYQWKPGSFVATLVGFATLAEKGASLRMDVLVNLAAEPAALRKSNPAALSAATREAGQIAQILVGSGLPEAHLSVGLSAGQARTVDVYFRKNKPFAPLPARDADTGKAEP